MAMTMARNVLKQWFPSGNITNEDHVDDSTGVTPIIGLKTPMNLEARVIDRLSRLLGANVQIENQNSYNMRISLSRAANTPQRRLELDEEVRKVLDGVNTSLQSMVAHKDGLLHNEATEDLWDHILIFILPSIDAITKRLRESFVNHREGLNTFIAKMFGMHEETCNDGSTLDRALGDRIIAFHEMVHGYKGSLKEASDLITYTSSMLQEVPHMRTRVGGLLGGVITDEIHPLINALGFPQQAYDTLVSIARTVTSFGHITSTIRTTSRIKAVTSSSSHTKSNAYMARRDSVVVEPVATITTQLAALPPMSPPSPTSSSTLSFQSEQARELQATDNQSLVSASSETSLDVVLPYLGKKDGDIGITRFDSVSKQETVQLIGTVLRDKLLPVDCNAWYSFGFVTTQTEDEERHLAGLYAALLAEADDPQAIFRDLLEAFETGKLVGLFDQKEYGHFRHLFPHLETFLSHPLDKRPTVWRLKQYVQTSDAIEPPPSLQRDYGFWLCRRREELQYLKAIYAHILQRMPPMDLHDACRYGRIFETAIRSGCAVDARAKRLVQSDWYSPYVGYENGKGLENYRRPFFKRVLRR